MENTKITYRHANRFDPAQPDCGFAAETEYIVTDGDYDFADWLTDNDVANDYDKTQDIYFVVDNAGDRTGEAYQIVSTEAAKTEIELIQNPYLDGTVDNAYFAARAVDSDGKGYNVRWNVCDDFDLNAGDDYEYACDWAKYSVKDDFGNDVTGTVVLAGNEYYYKD